MKQNSKSSSSATRMVGVSGLALFVLGSMLWEIVSAFIRGGSDAPTVGILIAAILILGGGMAFALYLIMKKGKPLRKQEQDVSDETPL